MSTITERGKGYLDFLVELMPGHADLRAGFLAKLAEADPGALCGWFTERGFQVTYEECLIMIRNRRSAADKAAACAWY